MNYEFTLLINERKGNDGGSVKQVHIKYYTGPFPLKKENGEITIYEELIETSLISSQMQPGLPKTDFPIIDELNKVLVKLRHKTDSKISLKGILAGNQF